jgi:lipopolysaccharide transport system ATP-binding protein
VWKSFQIPHHKPTTILEQVAELFSAFERERFTYETFWALSGISFDLKNGDSIGIVGENGSGKTTLLRIIAKIFRPDRGKVSTSGKIAPMLELGVGFHPDLSVKENITVFGSIMGLSSALIAKKTQAIVEFAGIQRFQDAKLRSLSGGMQVRLAFSIAIETNPDIFLIDEALAVGDMEFRNKCLDRFREFKKAGKTIVLVSHDLELVKAFCEQALFLREGKIVARGPSNEVTEAYARAVMTPTAQPLS